MKPKIRLAYAAIAAFLMLSSLIITQRGHAQAQFPDTPVGKQTKGWLEAFNAADPQKYKEFLTKSYPSQLERADDDMRFRQLTGGFELKKVEESTATKIVALVQERIGDQFARLSAEVDASEAHYITKLDLEAIARPAEFALPHLSERELVSALRKKLDEETAADRFSGAALRLHGRERPFLSRRTVSQIASRRRRTP
jgi:D-alanyl-D-alanine carboxypeptidase